MQTHSSLHLARYKCKLSCAVSTGSCAHPFSCDQGPRFAKNKGTLKVFILPRLVGFLNLYRN